MAKHRQVVRKVENEAIDPTSILRVDTSFVAPYGHVIGAKTHEAHDLENTDMGAIDHAMQWQNDRHTRAMSRHTAHRGEMRFADEEWSYTEASAWGDMQAQLKAQKEHNAWQAKVEIEYGWLNKYFQPETETHDVLPFEELPLGNDPEIISESESNQMSPIFTSTGRTPVTVGVDDKKLMVKFLKENKKLCSNREFRELAIGEIDRIIAKSEASYGKL